VRVRESNHNATTCGVVRAVNESWTAVRRTVNLTGFFQDLGILHYGVPNKVGLEHILGVRGHYLGMSLAKAKAKRKEKSLNQEKNKILAEEKNYQRK
jgi:hypothetical protein